MEILDVRDDPHGVLLGEPDHSIDAGPIGAAIGVRLEGPESEDGHAGLGAHLRQPGIQVRIREWRPPRAGVAARLRCRVKEIEPDKPERLVADPLEKRLQEMAELDYVRTYSRSGQAVMQIQLKDSVRGRPGSCSSSARSGNWP